MKIKMFIPLLISLVILSACASQPSIEPTQLRSGDEMDRAVGESHEEPAAEMPVQEAPPQPVEAEPLQPMATQPIGQYPSSPPTPMPFPTGTQPPEEFPPADNFFENYGVNPFVDTGEDHLSTFALDVDTASYAVARRYIQDGLRPPADAIRVEEFVNYFEQGYPTPPEVAFGIYADGARSPFHTDGTYILRFGIQGYEVPEYARTPANLTFVIDVSGSMDRENRLELVKRSLEILVERLRPDDQVAIVVYGSQARVVLYPTPGSDTGSILRAIYSLQPEGSTNAEAGLQVGYQIAWEMFRQGYTNRVILCSDGVANVGATSPDAILESIRGYANAGITLTTIGFGMGKL